MPKTPIQKTRQSTTRALRSSEPANNSDVFDEEDDDSIFSSDAELDIAEESELMEDSVAASSSSSSTSQQNAAMPPVTVSDMMSLPLPPKGIPEHATPQYYALEKVKSQRDFAYSKLEDLRRQTDQAKDWYHNLLNRVNEAETEMAKIEEEVNMKSEEFFEARLQDSDDWNVMYKKLRLYQLEHGECNIKPKGDDDDDANDDPDLDKLRRWVRKQRDSKRKGTIKPFREAALERLNFAWEPRDDLWNEVRSDCSFSGIIILSTLILADV